MFDTLAMNFKRETAYGSLAFWQVISLRGEP